MADADPIIDLFRTLATPTIANALDDVAFDGVVDGLRQIVARTRTVGRAVTVRHVVGARGDYQSTDFKVGHMIDAARPGEILVIDMAGAAVSTFGGLATLAAVRKGLGGIVVDGGVRDFEEMEQHRLPVFARHMTPRTGRTRLQVAAIGEPIRCGGVRVRAGDIVVADGSGVVVVPAEHAETVAKLAARYSADDEAAAAALAAGLTFREAMAKFSRI